MRFGERLKQQRTKHGLTQDQVADKFLITRQTVSSWENEKSYPDIASLIKISDFYGVSLDTLLKEDTGMREYMEKKNVKNGLKSVKMSLFIIDVLLVIFFFTKEIFPVISNSAFESFILFMIMMINVVSMSSLDKFDKDNSLKMKFNWQYFLLNKINMKMAILISLFFFILFIIVLLVNKNNYEFALGMFIGSLILPVSVLKRKS